MELVGSFWNLRRENDFFPLHSLPLFPFDDRLGRLSSVKLIAVVVLLPHFLTCILLHK
jgi:hypothetical protein